MGEYNNFYIFNGEIELKDKGLVMRLTYPNNPQSIDKRLPGDLEFGIDTFKRLLNKGNSIIANQDNPVPPPSAGCAYLFADNRMLVNRRDMGAPTHKNYHSAYAGFPDSYEESISPEGIIKTALREAAEECLLITKDKKPWLIIPNDVKEYALESAERLGLDLPKYYIDFEWIEPTDRLEVYNEQGKLLFTHNALLEIIFESETSINAYHLRRVPLSSEEILPIDAEGMMKNGKFIHFNRESYIINPLEMHSMKFGDVMVDPLVFRTRIRNGKLQPYKVDRTEYQEPFNGPDGIKVIDPHIWAPDNQVVRYFHALGINGYNWIEMELWKEISKLEGKSLLSERVTI